MARMAGSDNESKLIAQSLSGDPEAYAALVSQHQTMIRAMTFRMPHYSGQQRFWSIQRICWRS